MASISRGQASLNTKLQSSDMSPSMKQYQASHAYDKKSHGTVTQTANTTKISNNKQKDIHEQASQSKTTYRVSSMPIFVKWRAGPGPLQNKF